jgi:hypothetical protein
MLVGERARYAALALAALAAAEVGHMLVYQTRFAGEPVPPSIQAAHGYLPPLLTVVTGLMGAAILALLLLVAAAHVAAGRVDRQRVARRPSLIDLWAALFVLQLCIFGVQELAEAATAGRAALSPAELLLWGVFGQVPASFLAAVALRWAATTFEAALIRLRTRIGAPAPRHVSQAAPRRPAPARSTLAQTAGPSLRKRGPPLSARMQPRSRTTLESTNHGVEHMPRSLPLIAGLTLLVAGACGGGNSGSTASTTTAPTATAVNTCAKAHQSPHVAYLVVQHLAGQTIERCAGFTGDTIDGATVMQETGTQFQMGTSAMCQVDHEPAQFSDCSPDQAHWTLWLYTGGAWTAQTGSYAQLQLHDRDGMGWRYVLSSTPPPSPPPAPQPM